METQAKKRARPQAGQGATNGFEDPNKAGGKHHTSGRSARAVNALAATNSRLYSTTKRLGMLYVDGSASSIGRTADGYQRAASRTKITAIDTIARRQATAVRNITHGYVSAARTLAQ